MNGNGEARRFESEPWDAIVLGAGVSGLIATKILQDQGLERVLVIDSYSRAGGNHIDVSAGPYTFDIGWFLFNKKSSFMKYFPQIADLYVPVKATASRINPANEVQAYPLSFKNEVAKKGPLALARFGLSLAISRLRYRRKRNAREFACYWVSDWLFKQSGLEGYIERFYSAPAAEIETIFAEKRMSFLKTASVSGVIKRLLRRRAAPSAAPPVVTICARPREGFAIVYDSVCAMLEERGATFRLGANVTSVAKDSDRFVVSIEGGATVCGTKLFSTIPITEAARLCALGSAVNDLQAATLVSLCFSFQGDRGFSSTILYNFSNRGKWKRLIVFSDYYGRANDREYFTVETNHLGEVDETMVAAFEQAFRADVRAQGIFNGDLKLETSHVLSQAYPIYRIGSTAEAERCIAALRDFGVDAFGRQGGFDYTPAVDDAVKGAERVLLGGRSGLGSARRTQST